MQTTQARQTGGRSRLRPTSQHIPTHSNTYQQILTLVYTQILAATRPTSLSEHLLQVEMMQLEVDAMQAEAASARAAAEAGQAAVLEVERLGQDNSLLAARLSQMDLDLQVGCPSAGHHFAAAFAENVQAKSFDDNRIDVSFEFLNLL